MEVEIIPLSEVIPYDKNPRKNDKAVDIVAKSIKEYGFNVPILLDKNNVIIAGHTRLKAAIKLKLIEVPVIRIENLTEAQVKAFRIMDNRSHEYAFWDMNLLKEELEILKKEGFDLDLTGFDDKILIEGYSRKIKSPIYEITKGKPKIEELYNIDKTNRLIKEIENSSVDKEIKEFLKYASYRHIVFNYENIAEFYAHSDKDVQKLMEDNALVILDFKKAIESGFIKLTQELANKYSEVV